MDGPDRGQRCTRRPSAEHAGHVPGLRSPDALRRRGVPFLRTGGDPVTPQEKLAALRTAAEIVAERGDNQAHYVLSRHIGDLAVEIALGDDSDRAMPGKRLHRMEL